MAAGLNEFAEHLNHLEKSVGGFEARPYYEPETDSLIYYIRDESCYSKRVTKFFGVFLSNRDDSLVGIEVKGLKIITKAIENLGDVLLIDPISLRDESGESFDLEVMVRCAMLPERDEPVKADQYAALDELTRGIKVSKRELCRL